MKKHLPKFVWLLAFTLGLYLLVNGFSISPKKAGYDASTTEKCNQSKTQSGLSISNLSHHILDFNK